MLPNVATLCTKGKDSVNEEDSNEGSQGTENANDQNQGYVGQLKMLQVAADRASLDLSTWIRTVALKAAKEG